MRGVATRLYDAAGLPLTLTPGLTVQRPDAVRKADGTPYTVFTPFSRAWHVLPRAERVDLLPSPQTMGFSAEITSLPSRITLPYLLPYHSKPVKQRRNAVSTKPSSANGSLPMAISATAWT